MPFTPAHAAAALLFRRTRLSMDALVIGTFAPDFPYFLVLSPSTGIGHTIPGALTISLPLGLAMLWLYEKFVRTPTIALLPSGLTLRLYAVHHSHSFRNLGTFTRATLSTLIGILTHIVWDSMTHRTMWPYRHLRFLRMEVTLLSMEPIPCYKLLQYGSSVLGCGILLLWFIRWYDRTSASRTNPNNIAPARFRIWLVLLSIAFVGSIVHAFIGIRAEGHLAFAVVGQAGVTFLALLWWELVVYGLVVRDRPWPPCETTARRS